MSSALFIDGNLCLSLFSGKYPFTLTSLPVGESAVSCFYEADITHPISDSLTFSVWVDVSCTERKLLGVLGVATLISHAGGIQSNAGLKDKEL